MFPFGFFKKALVGLGVVVCFNGEVVGTLMAAFPLVAEGDTDSFVVEPTLAIGVEESERVCGWARINPRATLRS